MTTDIEDRLRADLPRLADLLAETTVDASPLRAPARQLRRRRWEVAVAVAACLVLLAAVAIVSLHRDRGARVTSQPAPSGGPGSWRTLPPSPLGPRGHPVVVWTGTEILVWGGYRGDPTAPFAFQSGAAFDPATNAWHAIADNSWAHPGGIGAWVDDRMIVAAKNGAAEYVPATDHWQDLASLPANASGFIGITSSGATLRALVHGADPGTIAVATYDPQHDAWTIGAPEVVPWASGGSTDKVSLVSTDHEVVVWDGQSSGWAYDLSTDAWRQLPDLVVANRQTDASALALVNGQFLVVLAYTDGTAAGTGLRAARLDGDQWQTVVDGQGVAIAQPQAVDAGGTLLVIDRSGKNAPLRADLTSGRWTSTASSPLVPGADTTAVWTGAGLFVWGGLPDGTPTTFQNPSPNAPDAAWFTP